VSIDVRRRLPAGILDAGFASLATFAVGLAAVTRFGDVDRGVYAVFFAAFVAGALLSTELIFTPAEVKTVSFAAVERLELVPQSLRLGIGPSVLGTLAVAGAIAATQSYASAEVLIPLSITAAVSVVLSPMQDHIRRMFHIAGMNWRAALVSVVQFVVAVTGVGLGLLIEVPIAWIPFGALALANAVSLSLSLYVVRNAINGRPPSILRFVDLAASGRWFVLSAIAPAIASFAVVAIIGWVVSPEDLGYAESARVVAQPILVLAAGLAAVLAPRSMQAAMEADQPSARRTSRLYLTSMAGGGLVYGLMVGFDIVVNPMAHIVPSAYVLPGLVALTVAGNVVASAPFLQNNELAGAHQERTLARISWISSVAWLVGGLTAWLTGAYARAIGLMAAGATRYGAQARALASVYQSGPTPTAGSTDGPPEST